jgi:2'-5' RNA ligase
MSNLVLVAIPSDDDYVWNVSSEQVPHLTVLFLGDVLTVQNLSKIVAFVEHAAKTTLHRFGLDVERRGTLGLDEADVLFFAKSKWSGYEELLNFRSALLQEPNIRTAFDSVEQYPEWTPHLTMGYPATPAKKDERDFPGFSYVNFDRIALWVNDYDGFEFPLPTYDWESEVLMSDVSERGREAVDDITHHGVKGMRWGVRRKNIGSPTEVIVSDKNRKLKAKGGKDHPAHEDAIRAKTVSQKKKASGVKALSNEELQAYANRLNLEQSVNRLESNQAGGAKKFIASLLANTAKQQAVRVANDQASKQVDSLLKKK